MSVASPGGPDRAAGAAGAMDGRGRPELRPAAGAGRAHPGRAAGVSWGLVGHSRCRNAPLRLSGAGRKSPLKRGCAWERGLAISRASDQATVENASPIRERRKKGATVDNPIDAPTSDTRAGRGLWRAVRAASSARGPRTRGGADGRPAGAVRRNRGGASLRPGGRPVDHPGRRGPVVIARRNYQRRPPPRHATPSPRAPAPRTRTIEAAVDDVVDRSPHRRSAADSRSRSRNSADSTSRSNWDDSRSRSRWGDSRSSRRKREARNSDTLRSPSHSRTNRTPTPTYRSSANIGAAITKLITSLRMGALLLAKPGANRNATWAADRH